MVESYCRVVVSYCIVVRENQRSSRVVRSNVFVMMFHSPLEQFEIIPLRPLRRGSFDLSLTNSSLMMRLTGAAAAGAAQTASESAANRTTAIRRSGDV